MSALAELPLLAAEGLRVDVHGAVAISAATFVSRAQSIAVLGDGQGVWTALEGHGRVRAGSLSLLGHDVGTQEHLRSSVAGLAPLDPPLPPRWTARDYLAWSARLAGYSKAKAREAATATLAQLDLRPLGDARVDTLSVPQKRAVVLGAAAVTSPRVLLANAPLAFLSGADAAFVSAVWGLAVQGRSWIVSLGNLHAGSPEHALAASADELLIFAAGTLARQSKLRQVEEGTVGYSLTLHSRASEFTDALIAKGAHVSGGPTRFFIELPVALRPHDLMSLSASLGAPIVELVPRILLAGP